MLAAGGEEFAPIPEQDDLALVQHLQRGLADVEGLGHSRSSRPFAVKKDDLLQRCEKLAVDAAEAAVAEDGDGVTGLGFGRDDGDDFLDGLDVAAVATHRCDVAGELVGIEPLAFGDLMEIRDGGDDGEVRKREGFGELVLEDRALGGVRARFKKNPQAALGVALAQALDRELDGGRVVGEVIDDLDAVDLTTQFLAACDAFEGFQALADLTGCQSGERGRRHRHGGVADVELAGHADRVAFAAEVERTTICLVAHVSDPQRAAFRKADGGDGAGCVGGDFEAVRLVAVHKGHAAARDDVEQALEGQLDGVDRVVDVGVVELDVVHHDTLRKVVEELRALVEEGGVVFVAFEDVELGVREHRTLAEVFRQSADQEAGVASGVPEQPRQHRGGGGFPVGAGDDEVAFAAQEELLQDLGEGMVEQLAVERGLGLRVAA